MDPVRTQTERLAGWRQVKRWRPRLSQASEHTFVPKLGERGIGARGGARVSACVCVCRSRCRVHSYVTAAFCIVVEVVPETLIM